MAQKTYPIGSTVFDKWTIRARIGSGSFGQVYELEREEFGEIYRSAMKVITVPADGGELQSVLDEGMTQTQAKEYFSGVVKDLAREIAIMSRLKGTGHIVSCEDHWILPHETGIGWDILIRMELLHPLLQHAYEHPMARRDIIRLGIHICRALELCQKYNIIHRDLKPENIFISDNGDYKLGDFGIARTIERTTAGLSKKGTYQYMAPEVYRGTDYGFGVDLYSLGIVLYRLLNRNRCPFLPPAPQPITPRDRENALVRRMCGDPMPLPYYAQGRLGEIVLKACAFDPRDRYESPRQLREALESIQYEAEDAALIYPDGDELHLEQNRYHSRTPEQEQKTEAEPSLAATERMSAQTIPQPEDAETRWDPSAAPPAPPNKEKHKRAKGRRKGVWLGAAVLCAALIVGGVGLSAYQKQKEAETAAQLAAEAMAYKQEQYVQLLDAGMALCETAPEEALTKFMEARQLLPEEAEAWVAQAYGLYCAGRYAECIRFVEEELELGKREPFDAEDQSRISEILGAAYFEQQDYAAAASFFRLSTAGGPLTVSAQRDYAVSLGRLGDVAAADEVLTQMRQNGADSHVTAYVQAEVDYARGEYVQAADGFSMVLEASGDTALQKRCLRSLGEVYRDCAALDRVGDSPIETPATKAVELLSFGIETYGLRYDPTLWEMLALAYFESYHTDPLAPGDYLRKAAECFNRVLELGVTKDYLYSNLYTLYYEMEAYDKAEQILLDFEDQFPNRYEPHAFRAMLYITIENQKEQSQRDYAPAAAEFEAAGQKLRGDDDRTYYQQLESLMEQLRQEGWLS